MYTCIYHTYTHNKATKKEKNLKNVLHYSVLWLDIKWVSFSTENLYCLRPSFEPSEQTVVTYRELGDNGRFCQTGMEQPLRVMSGSLLMRITENQIVYKDWWKEQEEWKLWRLKASSTISNSASLGSCSKYPRNGALAVSWQGDAWCKGKGRVERWQKAWKLLPFALFLHGEASVGPVSLFLTNKHLCGINLHIMGCSEHREFTSGLLVFLGTETPVTLSSVVRGSHFWQERYWQTPAMLRGWVCMR